MPHTAYRAIPPHLIHEALERILASRGFRASARMQRFLQFIVQETLTGRADRIKGYTIAIDVFDRDATFDPMIDPVVRIQASRIRGCLEHYYQTDGAADPVRITIPKGRYVPHFALARGGLTEAPAQCVMAEPSETGRSDAIKKAELGSEPPMPPASPTPAPGSPPSSGRLPRILTPRMVMNVAVVLLFSIGLLLFPSWNAPSTRTAQVPPVSGIDMHGTSLPVLPYANGTGDPTYGLVTEGLTEDPIDALVRFRSIRVLGTDTGVRSLSASVPGNAEPSGSIDYALKGAAGQTGAQIQITVTLMGSAEPPPNASSSYRCMLRTGPYWCQLNPALHAQFRNGLTRAVQIDPFHAEAWAALAMVTVDEGRLGFNRSPARPDPVATGLQLAKHAVALSPDSPLPLQALGLAYWLYGEPQLNIAYE